MTSLHIAEACVPDHRVAFDQFTDAGIERENRFITGAFYFCVGNDVVALVWILSHRRIDEGEVGNLFLNAFAEFLLRNICVGKAYVVDLGLHLAEVNDRMLKHARDITYVHIVTLERTV
jgi:hypothetical protein